MSWFDDDDEYEWLGGDPKDPFNYAPKNDDPGCGSAFAPIVTGIVLFILYLVILYIIDHYL